MSTDDGSDDDRNDDPTSSLVTHHRNITTIKNTKYIPIENTKNISISESIEDYENADSTSTNRTLNTSVAEYEIIHSSQSKSTELSTFSNSEKMKPEKCSLNNNTIGINNDLENDFENDIELGIVDHQSPPTTKRTLSSSLNAEHDIFLTYDSNNEQNNYCMEDETNVETKENKNDEFFAIIIDEKNRNKTFAQKSYFIFCNSLKSYPRLNINKYEKYLLIFSNISYIVLFLHLIVLQMISSSMTNVFDIFLILWIFFVNLLFNIFQCYGSYFQSIFNQQSHLNSIHLCLKNNRCGEYFCRIVRVSYFVCVGYCFLYYSCSWFLFVLCLMVILPLVIVGQFWKYYVWSQVLLNGVIVVCFYIEFEVILYDSRSLFFRKWWTF